LITIHLLIEDYIDSFGIIESTELTTAPPELNTSSSFMTTTLNQQALLTPISITESEEEDVESFF
jgi:dimeric dUTPase (all-alpha-NTP-PPase superfamily)